MKQKKRSWDWPILFFSNPDERVLEIGCSLEISPRSFRTRLIRIDPDYRRLKDSAIRDGENAISIQGGIDVLPFLDQSLDGVIILESSGENEETLRRMLSEVKRILKENGQLLIFFKPQPFTLLAKSKSLMRLFKLLNIYGYSHPEIYWPYRSLRNVKRLIPLGSSSVERYIIRELTILHSEVNLLTWLKYLGMMILSYLNLFGKIIPQGYLISAHS